MKRLLKGSEGFTLVEMTVVIAIIAVLAALTLPAVTGVTTDTRSTSKLADNKQVDTAVTRFETDNPGDFPITEATNTVDTVIDTDGDGIIKIAIDTSGGALDVPAAITADVVCGDNTEPTLDRALVECFGAIDFAGDLVPDPLKNFPKHSSELVTASVEHLVTGTGIGDSTASSVDFEVTNCNTAGDTCEFYLDDNGSDLLAELNVWNITGDFSVFVFKDDSQYGK